MPEVKIENNSGGDFVMSDPGGGAVGEVPGGESKTFDISAERFWRIKGQIDDLRQSSDFTVTLPDTLDDHDDVGLPDQYDLTYAGKGGAHRGTETYLVNPSHPWAEDDGDGQTPFNTIQAALDHIGVPEDGDDQAKSFNVLIESGNYDEDITLPSMRNLVLTAVGTVHLTGSTNNITWNTDSADGHGIGDDPNLVLNTLSERFPEGSQAGREPLFVVDGNIDVSPTGTDPVVNLNQVRITGDLLTPSSGNEVDVQAHNCHFGGATIGSVMMNLDIAEDCIFDSQVICRTYGRLQGCDLSSGMSVDADAQRVTPKGLFACNGGGAFDGNATELAVDAVTNHFLNTNGATIGGSLAKTVLHDTTV